VLALDCLFILTLPGTVRPLLASISQTMPAHSVGEQHGAGIAPNKQPGHSYPAIQRRIQG